jgi:hypothetical protein
MRYWIVPLALMIVLARLPVISACDSRMDSFFESLDRAELVAVVRCVEAGAIVARFEVSECWKGEAPSAPLTIRFATSRYGPTHPIALVGERFVVAAQRVAPAIPHASIPIPTGALGFERSEWASQPADYRALGIHEFVRVPPAGDAAKFHGFGFHAVSLEKLRKLARLTSDERELRMLRGFDGVALRWSEDPHRLELSLPTVDAYLERVVARSATTAERRTSISRWLEGVGGRRIAAVLGTAHPLREALGEEGTQRVLAGIERRMAPARRPALEVAPIASQAGTTLRPSEPLAVLLERGNGPFLEAKFAMDFDAHVRRDPHAVALQLARLEPRGDDRRREFALATAARFARISEAPRIEHLEILLEAKDPLVRVAAAAAFVRVDGDRGRYELRRAMTYEGDAGDLAALELATLGEWDGFDRAFDLLRESPERGSLYEPLKILLVQRLAILLSNRAAAAGSSTPLRRTASRDPALQFQREGLHAEVVGWWNDSRGSIDLR